MRDSYGRSAMGRPGYKSIIAEVYDSGRVSGKHGTRHIRPARGQPFPQSLDMECDSSLETFPVGTRFRMNVKLKYREGQGEHLYSYWGWKAERLPDEASDT